MSKPNIIKSIETFHESKVYKKFNIKCRKVNFIIGDNGSGKTRLMNQIYSILGKQWTKDIYEPI